MEIVQQFFEFVVGDQIVAATAFCLGRRLFFFADSLVLARRCAGKLPFSVQLVEQRLELVVGYLVISGTLPVTGRRSGV